MDRNRNDGNGNLIIGSIQMVLITLNYLDDLRIYDGALSREKFSL